MSEELKDSEVKKVSFFASPGKWMKENVHIFAVTGYTVSAIVGTTGLIFMFGEKFGKMEQTQTDTKEVVVRIERDVDDVKSSVSNANVKLDTLMQRKENISYVENTNYNQDENGRITTKQNTAVQSNVPMVKLPKKVISATKNEAVQVRPETEEEESSFVVSEKYIKKQELKKKVNNNLKFVPAVFYGDQTLGDKATAYFRFSTPVEVNGQMYERNTQFYGETIKVSDQKLKFEISEIEGKPVNAVVFDLNKIEGLNSREVFKDGQKILLGFE